MTPRDFGFAVDGYRRRVERHSEMTREVAALILNVNRDTKEYPEAFRPEKTWPFSIDPPVVEQQPTFRLFTEEDWKAFDAIQQRKKTKSNKIIT